ncbi:hypothetical protein Tco_1358400 [Tanacetum coccineum]
MSDSEDSMVTYKEVSIPFEDLSDIGSPGVDGLPMMLEDPYVEASLQAPPSPDYVPGPKHPPSHVYVPYVPESVYPEFMPPEDDVLPAEEQPLPSAVSPTADSQDPADYPTDRDDDEEEDEEEPSRDDVDDENEEEDEDEEEEEHLAPADFVPPPACRTTARMSILDQTLIPFPHATEIPSPPLPVSSPLPVSPPPLPASPTYPLGYRAAMIRLRAESLSTSYLLPLPSPIILPHTRALVSMMRAVAPSTYILAPRSGILPSETPPSGTPPLLPIPLPTPSPPLLLPSTICRAGVSEVTLLPRKWLCIALGLIFEVGESSSDPTARPTRGFRADYGFVGTLDDEIRRGPEREVGYGITDTWDEMVEDMQGTPAATDVVGVSQRMADFVTTVRQDTNKIYRRLDDAHDDRLSHEAWVQSIDTSDTARSEVRALRTTVLAQQAEIEELWAVDRMRQTQLIEALTLMRTLQTQVTALHSQQGPASGPAQPEIPEEAGVADALATRDADRSRNGKDSHDSGTGVRRQAPLAYECTYPDFMKCKPLYFKGTKGVVELT